LACSAIGCATPAICNEGSIEQDIETMAANLNKRLPQQIDAVTRLERIEAGPGKAYSYVYTLSTTLDDSQKQQIREMTTLARRWPHRKCSPCSRPESQSGTSISILRETRCLSSR
jgi:hypothetical protein